MPKWATAILTKHAIDKIGYNNIYNGELADTFEKYDFKEASSAPGCQNFVKRWKNWEVGITAKQERSDKWIIVSAWKRKLF